MEPLPTLHSTLLERIRAAKHNVLPTARILLLLQPHDNPTAQWHQEAMRTADEECAKALGDDQNHKLAGLLLDVENAGAVHALEGPTLAISAYATALNEALPDKVRVLAAMEHVPRRSYLHWDLVRAADVSAQTSVVMDDANSEALEAAAADAAIAMIRLGRAAADSGPGHLETLLKSKSSREHEIAASGVSSEHISALLGAKGLPTLSDFLTIFEESVDVVLDEEVVWPPPPPLVYS